MERDPNLWSTAAPAQLAARRRRVSAVPSPPAEFAERAGASTTPPGRKLSVLVVVGTRPEAIKLVPIILALRRSQGFQPVVVSTGQHHRMVGEVFQRAGITPDVMLWVGDARAALNERVTSVMLRFDDFCREWYPRVGADTPTPADVQQGRFPAAVLVHGDTSSALAAALAAFHLQIPVVHVEAGLRAGGSNITPFPEELNRRLISRIACLHLAPTPSNQENLVRENVPTGQIFVTGNTGIDALHWASTLHMPYSDPALEALEAGDRRIVVVTAHRRENWGEGLRGIAEAVRRLAVQHPELSFVLPVHPNPRVGATLRPPLEALSNVLLTEPLGYGEFARLLTRCHLVITDSGGIQEEAPALGKPVLVTRESTERVEGVEEGTLLVVGTDPDRIVREAEHLLGDPAAYERMSRARNPYGDGLAARRIVAALEYLRTGGTPPTAFRGGFTRSAVVTMLGSDWLAASRPEIVAAPALAPEPRALPGEAA